MTLVVIEGAHGTAKSTLVRAAAEVLGWRAWHHPAPPAAIAEHPVRVALWYAHQRSMMLATQRVDDHVLADRWWSSSAVIALRVADGLVARAVGCVVEAEELATHPSCHPRATILLDAAGEVLDARLRARWERDGTFAGMPPHEVERVVAAKLSRERSERAIYRNTAAARGWPVVRSDAGTVEEVTAELVRVVKEVTT